MTKYVAEVLEVVQPDVYLRPEDMGDLSLMNIKRKIQRTNEEAGSSVFSRMFEHLRKVLGITQPTLADRGASLLQELIEAGGSTDAERWAAASELTAYRVGLLLSGDLRIAGQMICQEQASLGMGATWSPRDKIKELVLYGISEDYFAARRAIGVNVQCALRGDRAGVAERGKAAARGSASGSDADGSGRRGRAQALGHAGARPSTHGRHWFENLVYIELTEAADLE